MATYSNNQTLAVSAAVSASSSLSGNNSATVYTVPANSYAIVNIAHGGSGAWSLGIQGVTLYSNTSNLILYGVHLGPGQTVSHSSSGGGSGVQTFVNGVLFTNTP